jgi:hypothetical protein
MHNNVINVSRIALMPVGKGSGLFFPAGYTPCGSDAAAIIRCRKNTK